ncbi:MAG: hypothetical protein HYU71_11320 [Bacteroidetes bacterium]|nr:hypothetical protein [Bacteroidota bacterium]
MCFCSPVLFAGTPTAKAQDSCLPNIGFEMGDLSYWETCTGRIFTDGKLGLNRSNPVASRHKLLQNSNQQVKDFYGGFLVNCPNGSGYSMRLGNDSIMRRPKGWVILFPFLPPGIITELIIFAPDCGM